MSISSAIFRPVALGRFITTVFALLVFSSCDDGPPLRQFPVVMSAKGELGGKILNLEKELWCNESIDRTEGAYGSRGFGQPRATVIEQLESQLWLYVRLELLCDSILKELAVGQSTVVYDASFVDPPRKALVEAWPSFGWFDSLDNPTVGEFASYSIRQVGPIYSPTLDLSSWSISLNRLSDPVPRISSKHTQSPPIGFLAEPPLAGDDLWGREGVHLVGWVAHVIPTSLLLDWPWVSETHTDVKSPMIFDPDEDQKQSIAHAISRARGDVESSVLEIPLVPTGNGQEWELSHGRAGTTVLSKVEQIGPKLAQQLRLHADPDVLISLPPTRAYIFDPIRDRVITTYRPSARPIR